MVMKKKDLGDKNFLDGLFSKITLSQIYFLLTYFQPSKLCPDPVPSGVLNKIQSWGNIDRNINHLFI